MHIKPNMVKVKRGTKSLDINIRHTLALDGRDRHKILVIREVLHQLYVQYTTHIENNDLVAAAVTRRFIAAAMTRYRNVSTVEITHAICYGGDRYRFNSPLLQPGVVRYAADRDTPLTAPVYYGVLRSSAPQHIINILHPRLSLSMIDVDLC
jgi:hypothetical protein